MEPEVQIHHLSEQLLGKWPSMFFVLHFIFTATSVSVLGASSPGVLCRSWPPLQMLLTLSESSRCYSKVQSLRTELAVASVLYFPQHVYYGAER